MLILNKHTRVLWLPCTCTLYAMPSCMWSGATRPMISVGSVNITRAVAISAWDRAPVHLLAYQHSKPWLALGSEQMTFIISILFIIHLHLSFHPTTGPSCLLRYCYAQEYVILNWGMTGLASTNYPTPSWDALSQGNAERWIKSSSPQDSNWALHR